MASSNADKISASWQADQPHEGADSTQKDPQVLRHHRIDQHERGKKSPILQGKYHRVSRHFVFPQLDKKLYQNTQRLLCSE